MPRDIRDQDVARLVAVITNERDQAMFALMVGAGLRVGEVATLGMESIEEPLADHQLVKLRANGKGNKERIVWLTPSIWSTLQAWLKVRPTVETDDLFVNHRGRPISVNGIQYRLSQYGQTAGVKVTCHQLRHTFARRLVESGLPVDSLARLLGHNQLQTTQRYIDGADPTVRADFVIAMTKLENALARDHQTPESASQFSPPTPPRIASPEALLKLRQRLTILPTWLAEALDAYLRWRWPTWRAQTAYQLGANLFNIIRRIGEWLTTHRAVESWESFKRADLEAWLQARSEDGVSDVTIENNLGQLYSLLKFLEARDYPIDPGLFRVQGPKNNRQALPRYLPEGDYRRLSAYVLQETATETYHAAFDQACFLTLAHTGVRLSELLDLRFDDLNLIAGFTTIRGSKPGRDRVVYLTPALVEALRRYLDQRPRIADDHIFVLNERVPTARTIQRRLAYYGEQVGVHLSPHRLRHTFATRLLNQGIPIHSLRKLLGHQYLDTTQVYARVYDETLYQQFKEAMSRLEAIAVDDWPLVEGGEPALMDL